MSDDVERITGELFRSARLIARAEFTAKSSIVPGKPGLYAWFFRTVPPRVPTDGCLRRDGATLLYVGISPRRPPKPGTKKPANLRGRLRSHMKTDASWSTLRLSLGCLLVEQLQIELGDVGGRIHFASGEDKLDAWLDSNALVCWAERPRPWEIEATVVQSVRLPLNLEHNEKEPFRETLSSLRREMRRRVIDSTSRE